MTISSPPLRYTGGKWNLAPWIIGKFPTHTCYVEPFCGGASVLLRKKPSTAEVINDLNGDILNFFDALRDHTQCLIRAIELTPHSRAELERAQFQSDDSIENARRFYIRSRQSFMSGESSNKPAWRFEINVHKLIDGWNKTSHLWDIASRLKHVQLECDKAENVISRFDDVDTLFYVDPPYVHSTRTASNDYAFEMSDDEHKALAKQLNSIAGMVVLSGYDSELYRNLYPNWRIESIETETIKRTKRTECLWLNPAAQSRQSQKRLF